MYQIARFKQEQEDKERRDLESYKEYQKLLKRKMKHATH